jgi:hypothetical protein
MSKFFEFSPTQAPALVAGTSSTVQVYGVIYAADGATPIFDGGFQVQVDPAALVDPTAVGVAQAALLAAISARVLQERGAYIAQKASEDAAAQVAAAQVAAAQAAQQGSMPFASLVGSAVDFGNVPPTVTPPGGE